MKPTVYIETSVVSYLTAWTSSQLVLAGQQQATREWWQQCREDFDLFISYFVLQEASRGDPEAAERRTGALKGISELVVTKEAERLASALVDDLRLPPNAELDAYHIAVAATNRIDFLLTWNCRHIANPRFRYRIEEICRKHGFEPPVICTPSDLMEKDE